MKQVDGVEYAWFTHTHCKTFTTHYYAPPLIGGDIKRCFCLTSVCLTSVCLSVTYIVPNSRTERPRKTKIGNRGSPRHTWLGHHFQGQRSRSPGRFAHHGFNASDSCSGGRENMLAIGDCCYVAVCLWRKALRCPRGRRWAGHTVVAARLQLVQLWNLRDSHSITPRFSEPLVVKDTAGSAICPLS